LLFEREIAMLIELSPSGVGFDFLVFWGIARAILQGNSPYSIPGSFYPPATSYLFTPLALVPPEISFIAMTLLSCAAFATVIKKPADLVWLLFWPVGQVLYSGQTSLLFVPLIALIASQDRRVSAIGAALLTLKPQIAIIILPWYVVRWVIDDRRRLAYFISASCAVHLWPLLIRPGIFIEWFNTMGLGISHKAIISSGIWLFKGYLPTLVLVVLSLALSTFILLKDRQQSQAALALASPVTGLQDTVMLIKTAPAWLMVPVSLIALAWSRIAVSTLPGVLIAAAAFIYRFSESNMKEGGFLRSIIDQNRWSKSP
jgi:hypothetical protein